jgi:hypothetical protein
MSNSARRLFVAFALSLPGVIQAQDRPRVAHLSPFNLDLALDVGQAIGEFNNYVNEGIGGHAAFRFRPNPTGPFALRVSGDFLVYGSSTKRYPLIPGIAVDVTTSNNIVGGSIGPEMTLGGAGRLQMYGFAGVGFSYFVTSSAVEGADNTNSAFASTTNYDDVTLATEGGAGLRFQFTPSAPVFLDLGARYLNNGRTTYVTKGGLQVSGNQLLVNPIESEANLILYHLGVSINFADKTKRTGQD